MRGYRFATVPTDRCFEPAMRHWDLSHLQLLESRSETPGGLALPSRCGEGKEWAGAKAPRDDSEATVSGH